MVESSAEDRWDGWMDGQTWLGQFSWSIKRMLR